MDSALFGGLSESVLTDFFQDSRTVLTCGAEIRDSLQFTLVDFDISDVRWAMQQLLAYRLSHNVSLTDCMIASVYHRLQVPLYTHNRKHIEPISRYNPNDYTLLIGCG